MKILMLNNEYPPLGGGTASINQNILEKLINNQKLKIDLVTSALGNMDEEIKLSQNINLIKVPVNNQNIHHSSNSELIKYFLKGLKKSFRLEKEKKYNICMAWCSVPAGAIALFLKLITGLPYIVRVSGPDIPGFEARYNNIYPFLKPLLNLIWRNAEVVIAKCEHEKKMISYSYKKANIEIIPNAVDMNKFSDCQRNFDEKIFNFLCVARLVERKGQELLINCIDKLRNYNTNFNLHLVGTGDGDSYYKKLVNDKNLNNFVTFHGYVERTEIIKFYSMSHAFVLLSDNEGMTAAGLEALAAGLPLVISKNVGMDDLVLNNKNGFLVERDKIDLIVEKLNLLISNRNLTKVMGEASRTLAKEFSWENVITKYQSLFNNLKR